MNRLEIINALISKYDLKSYLEIGCQNNKTFNVVNCPIKVGIDPEKGGTLRLTSDEYFDKKESTIKFDLIFIDGLHIKEQTLKDIKNALKCLNKDGFIIIHDCLPTEYEMQLVPRKVKVWTGNVWEAFVELRKTRSTLEMCVVDVDFGCGIIKNGKQEKLVTDKEINFNNFIENKKEWMNIISWKGFKKKYLI